MPNPKKVVPKVVRRRQASAPVWVPHPGGDSSLLATASGGSGSNDLAHAAADAPKKTGMLIKYTNAFKGWKPRLFTLDTGMLTYVSPGSSSHDEDDDAGDGAADTVSATSPAGATTTHAGTLGDMLKKKRIKRKMGVGHDSKDKERDIRGIIEVQFAIVTADDADTTRFAIDVGHDVYHVKAASQEERDAWVDVLNASKQYFTSLVERAALRSSRSPGGDATSTAVLASGASEPATSAETVVTGTVKKTENSGDASPAVVTGPELEGTRASSSASRKDEASASVRSGEEGLEDRVRDSGAPVIRAHDPLPDAQSRPSADGPALRHLPSSSTVDTQLEDDGVAEAAIARRALLTELRRVCAFTVAGDPASLEAVFDDADAASGVRDLAIWALHVLQTDRALIDRRIAAGVQRAMRRMRAGSAVPYHDDEGGEAFFLGEESEDDDDGYDTSEFFDAFSRTASDRRAGEANDPSSNRSRSLSERLADVPGVEESGENVDTDKENESDADADDGAEDKRRLVRVDTEYLTTAAGKAPRLALPPLQTAAPKLNVWAILKDAVGKDLSKISIPVGLNEPSSFLQRLAEDIEYSELLDQAAAEPDQYRRMMLVATMIISHYSSTQNRIGKPFNPLLGETFSLVMPNKGNGVRFVAEQVSHHPPVSACYAEGSGASWKYHNAIEIKNKFWGKSLEFFATGWNYVEIPAYGDLFEFEQVTACVHNIFLGASKMWLDNYGDMEIVNRATGDRCVVTFQKSGWMSDAKTLGTVTGVVYDAAGSSRRKFSGRWTDAVYEDLPRRQRKLLWQVKRRPPLAASNNYNMTQWAIALNQPVAPEDLPRTAPTSSVLRPDQRALEEGKFDLAGHLKSVLEDGQRERRLLREERGQTWSPRWFSLTEDPETGRSEYLFNHQYFQAEADGEWEGCEDLFSCATESAGP